MVWSEEGDREDSEEDGLLMHLEGEEEEGEGRGDLLRGRDRVNQLPTCYI